MQVGLLERNAKLVVEILVKTYLRGIVIVDEGWWCKLLREKLAKASPKVGFISLCTVGVSAMKIPKDTSKLKKHIALMCDRLNKGGKLDLSSQTGEPPVQQQQQKAVAPLEPLSEMQEEEDETG